MKINNFDFKAYIFQNPDFLMYVIKKLLLM